MVEGNTERRITAILSADVVGYPYAVKGIHDFWKHMRQPVDHARKPIRKKAGRNEPCPCGSERKYKRCCGAN